MRFRLLSTILAHLVASILLLSIFTLGGVVIMDKALSYVTTQFGIDSFLFSTTVMVSKVLILTSFVSCMIGELLFFTLSLRRKEVEALREADKPFFDRVDQEISRRIAADKA